jgi:hypothetical protein
MPSLKPYGPPASIVTANGHAIQQCVHGYLGVYGSDGLEILHFLKSGVADPSGFAHIRGNGVGLFIDPTSPIGDVWITNDYSATELRIQNGVDRMQNTTLDNSGAMSFPSAIGHDDRGVTTADATQVTIVASSSGTVEIDLFAWITAYTSGSATYSVNYVVNGQPKSLSGTVAALNANVSNHAMVAPDGSSLIQTQVTGTFTATVLVKALVKKVLL